ncbi:transcriptional regulator, AraC family [Thermoclostridium stercorarium subsp. stercorarium DSM 8532]|jgi:AraC-like DNA-binding protein|uniref:Transcriptional regulator, AraC family n=4 Tax=Thermoclostridium stercorarium TaxID=1510 RepID=L7VQ64_THES1|nr:transcriptional regulator, AraC family [Thermoclostridium stercorarium subsp. stercorarium DSM 8532]AGI39837.1 DNA-binding domain-containing protein [Thermoclostridium stercorarium subsp. stercorarium DSM 8532]ANW99144.1 AraC family transcriptional regulator [Thermoclostridium stercorarium subsp. thermolacticum DSM 2910]ANX01708.1 AraC family transcriptional regulator [Thermoclostridium stercorarium subsp. leptospartum DSM 9219]
MTAEFKVFDGISLILRNAEIHKFDSYSSYPSGFVEIVYCKDGRIEYALKNMVIYLKKGDLGIIQGSGRELFICYPTRHYQGVSVIIDLATVPDNLASYLDGVDVSINKITNKICRCKNYYVMQATKRLEAVFEELIDEVPENYKTGYYRVKILELLMLLSGIDSECSKHHEQCCSREQAELIRKVCDYIRENVHVRLTIEEIAKQFHISSSQLKKCFHCVCGTPVYSFIRSYKMQLAAKDLKDTNLSVTEIAASYGYENSSKFANAFKAVMGMSPSEYRKEMRRQSAFLELIG